MIKFRLRVLLLVGAALFATGTVDAQRYLSDFDSSYFVKDTLRPVIKRLENLRFTGYIQPQFQIAQSDGAPSFAGPNFSPGSQSRFMLRRARFRMDYLLPSKYKYPQAMFVFQIDATERGVIVRDVFLKMFETKKNLFSFTAGLFARPFGYEVNLASAVRETPERGRMSQILMPSERDLGLMASFEPQEKKNHLSHLKFDIGFFNGQGVTGPTDFDNHKDVISRFSIKYPYELNNFSIAGGLSLLRGGWDNGTKYVYEMGSAANGDKTFLVDSSSSNLGEIAPRHYYGGDMQLKLKHGWGESELRTEYWFGTQPGVAVSTISIGIAPAVPTYVRHFDGAFLLFLQNIVNQKNQLMVKYDWYDPNIKVSKAEIGKPGTNMTAADIRFSTLGIGYAYYFNSQFKVLLYYDIVKNESTQLAGYTTDLKDNILTLRVQLNY